MVLCIICTLLAVLLFLCLLLTVLLADLGLVANLVALQACRVVSFARRFSDRCWRPATVTFLTNLGRVKNEKIQLGITAICFFGTILYGETEFTALSMF